MRLGIGCVVVALVAGVSSGCASMQPAPASTPITVLPEWKAFVLQNYQWVVKNQLKAPTTAEFEREPFVTAAYDPSKDETSLTALGDVDAQNSFGALMRSSYFVTWRQKGNGDGLGCWTTTPKPGPLPKDTAAAYTRAAVFPEVFIMAGR